MNRRDFLRGMLAAPLAFAVSKIPAQEKAKETPFAKAVTAPRERHAKELPMAFLYADQDFPMQILPDGSLRLSRDAYAAIPSEGVFLPTTLRFGK